MTVFADQVIAVNILIGTVLFDDKDFAAQFEQRIELRDGQLAMVEILPYHHLLFLH
jgi:hypothetical protein